MPNTIVKFLALGDSYTIGESVESLQSWPNQLTVALREHGIIIKDACVIAQTGWMTRDLLKAIKAANPQGPYDLITLLIGVNNQYQGKDIDSYRDEFDTLLDLSIDFAGKDPTRVVVMSIPDWGVTPFAKDRDRDQIREQIDRFNHTNQTESQAAGVHYLDITPISRQAADETTLLTSDNLHPSGKMYAAWVDLLLPIVREILHS